MAFKPVGQGAGPIYAPPSWQKVVSKEDKKGPMEVFDTVVKRLIVIVDYGMGNLRSVQKALEKMGFAALISDKPEDVTGASGLILPGVGAFGAAMVNLEKRGLVQPIKDYLKSGRPFLGICLGLQVLFESSEETFDPSLGQDNVPTDTRAAYSQTEIPGLGILAGQVKKFAFPLRPDLQVPHMGWNSIDKKKDLPLLEGVPADTKFYFVHSYYVEPADPAVIGATTNYGLDFVSVVRKDNIFASQFHPEKSGPAGLQILANFGRSCPAEPGLL